MVWYESKVMQNFFICKYCHYIFIVRRFLTFETKHYIWSMKFKIDHKSNIPLYSQVIKAVKDAIKKGELNNGDALPSLNEFANLYGVSMETAKKAYNILKKEGFLSSRQGRVNIRK